MVGMGAHKVDGHILMLYLLIALKTNESQIYFLSSFPKDSLLKNYEGNAKGNLSDERFGMMSKTYEDEQAQLKVEIVNLQKEVEVQERQIENLEQFIHRVRRYTTLTELTPYALRELVKAVYVEAPDKSCGKRKQKVHIEYDLVGYIPVDELIKAEQA